MWAEPMTLRPVPNFGSERKTGGLQEALSYLHAGLVEGRVGFEPTTPGLRGTGCQTVKAADSKSGPKPALSASASSSFI
jgi:hypothetical protein